MSVNLNPNNRTQCTNPQQTEPPQKGLFRRILEEFVIHLDDGIQRQRLGCDGYCKEKLSKSKLESEKTEKAFQSCVKECEFFKRMANKPD